MGRRWDIEPDFSTEALLPCPFCGNPGRYAVDWRGQDVCVECSVCDASADMFHWCEYDEYDGSPCGIVYAEDAFRMAAEAWNRRDGCLVDIVGTLRRLADYFDRPGVFTSVTIDGKFVGNIFRRVAEAVEKAIEKDES